MPDPMSNKEMPLRRQFSSLIYAAGHFLVDFNCALLLLSNLPGSGWFLVYNFCAFALQMPIGVLADMMGRNRAFSLTGIFLVLLALLPFPIELRVILAGAGNACYHVGGGREALLSDRKMTGLGLFVSPGALGIYLGAVLAGSETAIHIAGILLAVCALMMVFCCDSGRVISAAKGNRQPGLAGLMLLIVVIRSVLGLSMETPWKTGIYVVTAAVLGALGKAAGGILGDRLGGKRAGILTLLFSAVLFCFPEFGVAGVLGLFLFNMTMPITLRKAADALPGWEGFAFGLLTFGLFIGYLPVSLGWHCSSWFGAAMAAVSALLMMLDKEKNHSEVIAP